MTEVRTVKGWLRTEHNPAANGDASRQRDNGKHGKDGLWRRHRPGCCCRRRGQPTHDRQTVTNTQQRNNPDAWRQESHRQHTTENGYGRRTRHNAAADGGAAIQRVQARAEGTAAHVHTRQQLLGVGVQEEELAEAVQPHHTRQRVRRRRRPPLKHRHLQWISADLEACLTPEGCGGCMQEPH